MKNVIRKLPALAAAFILGAMIMSPGFNHATQKVKNTEVALVLVFALAAWVLLYLITGGRQKPEEPQQQRKQRPWPSYSGRN